VSFRNENEGSLDVTIIKRILAVKSVKHSSEFEAFLTGYGDS
jgi:hypothetical protein